MAVTQRTARLIAILVILVALGIGIGTQRVSAAELTGAALSPAAMTSIVSPR